MQWPSTQSSQSNAASKSCTCAQSSHFSNRHSLSPWKQLVKLSFFADAENGCLNSIAERISGKDQIEALKSKANWAEHGQPDMLHTVTGTGVADAQPTSRRARARVRMRKQVCVCARCVRLFSKFATKWSVCCVCALCRAQRARVITLCALGHGRESWREKPHGTPPKCCLFSSCCCTAQQVGLPHRRRSMRTRPNWLARATTRTSGCPGSMASLWTVTMLSSRLMRTATARRRPTAKCCTARRGTTCGHLTVIGRPLPPAPPRRRPTRSFASLLPACFQLAY